MRRASAVVALGAAALLAGCGSGGATHPRPGTPARAGGAPPALTARHPCDGAGGFTCATLRVPLDRAGTAGRQLDLRVAVQRGRAPRGVLVLLTGGPGQPGVPFVDEVRSRLGDALRGYRLVMLDQRGTGATALDCPALQRAMGVSDLTVPPAAAVRTCALRLGPQRAFYSTADTVADLDDLRRALGIRRLTLDGVSYGTYVAERYALAHPHRVSRLVLDSVVPHAGADPLQLENMRAAGRVLDAVCRASDCPSDPAEDLAAVVDERRDGPRLLDTLVALSVAQPDFDTVPAALREARAGDQKALDRIVAGVAGALHRTSASELSQGLHASTLCADARMPWGDAETPTGQRGQALRDAVDRLPARAFGPFGPATAAGNGLVRTCLAWPPTATQPLPPSDSRLPAVPVLLLAGDRDLSTPLAWARAEARLAPRGRLVVAPGAGHSVQLHAGSPAVDRALRRFLRR